MTVETQGESQPSTTATTAPYGDPMTSQSPMAPQQEQPAQAQPQQGSRADGMGDELTTQLKQFLDTVNKEPSPEQEQDSELQQGKDSEPDRPTGGLNDITADQIGEPGIARFVQLLDAHYPQIDRERVLGRALEFGDPEFIDTAYLKDVVGDHSDILLGYFQDVVQTYGNALEQTVQSVYERAGGQEKWNALSAAFVRNAPESVRNVVKQLIDSPD